MVAQPRFAHIKFQLSAAFDRDLIAVTDKLVPQVRKLSEVQRNILDLLNQSDHPPALGEIHAGVPASASIRQVKRSLALPVPHK